MKHIAAIALIPMFLACGSATTASMTDADVVAVLNDDCPLATSLRAQYRAMQGPQLEGLTGGAFTVQAARVGCHIVDALSLQGGQLSGSLDGQPLGSADFRGAALLITDANGVSKEIAITQVDSDPKDPTGETQMYTLATLGSSGQTVQSVCTADPQGRRAAIPLRGEWDATGAYVANNNITFHCTSGAIGKCVNWGYRPWQSQGNTSLAPYHQACTRMARADYCGEGNSYTQEGTTIDIYDKIGLLNPTSPLGLLTFEAAWTPQGAYCISRERWLTLENLLTPICKSKFVLSIELSPVRPSLQQLDLCLVRRSGAQPQDALLSNRTALHIGL